MDEHKLLTGMLLIALVVTVVGTLVTVDRLSVIDGGSVLTGAISGSANLSITEDITISLPSSLVEIGSGKVAANATFAVVDTSSTVGVEDGTWANSSYNITFRNDGNEGVNVTVQSNVTRGNASGEDGLTYSFACSGDTDDCGNAFTNNTGDELDFAFKASNNEDGSCAASFLTSAFQSFHSADLDYKLCGCLSADNSNDEVATFFKMGVPDDTTGLKEATLTFTAVSSDETC